MSASTWHFVRADAIQQHAQTFAGLDVRSASEPTESLGRLAGFVVDSTTFQLHFAVVESAGWFSGDAYLVPPAYTRVDAEQGVLWLETTRDLLERFPAFDPDRMPELSRDELWRYEQPIIEAYGNDPGVAASSSHDTSAGDVEPGP